VDVCYDRLLAIGARDFMVNLGGNIRCHGQPCRGEPWTIGVRNPFNTGEIIGTLRLTNGMAVATSGNYERFVVIGIRAYAHIMDPRTGYPVSGMAGVTVVTTNGVQSDALSTALFVLGVDGSKAALSRVGSCEALFIPNQEPLKIVTTPGLPSLFTMRAE
jgi:FAD:protein FMN transferase